MTYSYRLHFPNHCSLPGLHPHSSQCCHRKASGSSEALTEKPLLLVFPFIPFKGKKDKILNIILDLRTWCLIEFNLELVSLAAAAARHPLGTPCFATASASAGTASLPSSSAIGLSGLNGSPSSGSTSSPSTGSRWNLLAGRVTAVCAQTRWYLEPPVLLSPGGC